MDTGSLLEANLPAPQPAGNDQLNIAAQLDSEINDLNRQITAAVVMELTTGGLSEELAAIIQARDLLRARLLNLEGATDR